jgi:nucleoside-diphosphate-sugar epimerase
LRSILVTGGAGYIGSVLVRDLLYDGNDVLVLDNFSRGQNSLFELCIRPGFKVVNGDVRNPEILKECLRSVDTIIPLAALVGAPICSRDETAANTTNFDAIKLLVDCASRSQEIIFPCTNSGYGVSQKNNVMCDETSPLVPISLYGKTKVAAERLILNRGNSISLRLATVFGVSPQMRFDLLVNNFVYRALTDGCVVLYEPNFKRNYVHVRDVSKAFIHCMDNFETMKNEAYNVGLSSANLSKFELCQEIKKVIPDFYFTESPIGKDVDQRNYLVSNKKIEKTKFIASYSIAQGVKEIKKCVQMLNLMGQQGNVPVRNYL